MTKDVSTDFSDISNTYFLADMNGDIGPYSLTDTSSVKVKIEETIEGMAKSRRSLPRLIANRNVKAENISKASSSHWASPYCPPGCTMSDTTPWGSCYGLSLPP